MTANVAEMIYELEVYNKQVEDKGKALADAAKRGRLAKTLANTKVGSKMLTKMMEQLGETIAKELPAYYKASPVFCKQLGKDVVDYLTTPDLSHTTKAGTEVMEDYLLKANRFALVALSECLNAQTSKEGSNTYVGIAVKIGRAIETEMRIAAYKKANPMAFVFAEQFYLNDPLFGHGAAVKAMLSNLDERLAKDGIEVSIDWSNGTDDRTKYAAIGGWMLACVVKADKAMFALVPGKRGKHGVPAKVEPTAYLGWDEAMELASKGVNYRAPMTKEPIDWSNTSQGGYACNGDLINQPMVKKNPNAQIGDAPIAFLNKLQKVAYTANTWIVGLVNDLQLDPTFAGFGSFSCNPKEHEMGAVEKVLLDRKQLQSSNTLAWANEVGEQPYWLAWNFDWRGRAYPLTDLNTQATDFGKAVVKFAEGGEVTAAAEKWLAIHLANTFGNGVDKDTLQARVQWVHDNQATIADVVSDPIAYVQMWLTDPEAVVPDEPWQFMAACEEWVAVVMDKTRTTTNLPVGADATCSGLQILAGLTKDTNTATYVNVIGGELPSDAYMACVGEALSHIDEAYHPLVTRKIAKPVVMTTPYNAGRFSNGNAVQEALREAGHKVDIKVAGQIAGALRDGLKALMPKALEAMEWVSNGVYAMTKAENKTTLEWTTPSGFVVKQQCFASKVKQVKVASLGMTIALNEYDHSTADCAKHKRGTAPNLIHSLDGSLLHLSFAGFDKPFSCIHDCVLTRACDMDEAVAALKDSYTNVFNTEVLAKFAADIGLSHEGMPTMGDLDPAVVQGSDYFFN